MAHELQTPTHDAARAPLIDQGADVHTRAALAALWARLVALHRPLLGVTVTYLGYGALGLLLVAGLGDRDLALMYVGAALALYGGGLGKAINAHAGSLAGRAPRREGEAIHGA